MFTNSTLFRTSFPLVETVPKVRALGKDFSEFRVLFLVDRSGLLLYYQFSTNSPFLKQLLNPSRQAEITSLLFLSN